ARSTCESRNARTGAKRNFKACAKLVLPVFYLPTTRIENESGSIGPRAGPRPPRPCGGAPPAGGAAGGGGGGPYSAAIVRIWFVFVSSVSVLAPTIVWRSCSTAKLVGLFSLTIVMVPLPCELKASIVAGLKTTPSEPPTNGSEVMILPSSALRITIRGCAGVTAGIPDCPHAAKSTWFLTSSARPLQRLPL